MIKLTEAMFILIEAKERFEYTEIVLRKYPSITQTKKASLAPSQTEKKPMVVERNPKSIKAGIKGRIKIFTSGAIKETLPK